MDSTVHRHMHISVTYVCTYVNHPSLHSSGRCTVLSIPRFTGETFVFRIVGQKRKITLYMSCGNVEGGWK